MKIKELITESQVTDEGVLGSVAAGAGTALGAVGKGLGAISGAWKGAKDQYQKGQALGRAHVGGHMPQQPKDTSVRDQEFARLTGKGQPAAGGAPAQGDAPAANPQDIEAQIKAKEQEIADLKAQQKQAQKQPPQELAPPPQTQPGIGQASGGNNAAATATEPHQSGATAPTNTAAKQADPNATLTPTGVSEPGDPRAQQAPAPEPAPEPAPQQGADNQVAQQQQQKLDPKAQNALKARLKAGQGAGAKTGGGFKDYVGGSQTKLTGADAQGNPVFKKLQRESVDFYSSFLGQKL